MLHPDQFYDAGAYFDYLDSISSEEDQEQCHDDRPIPHSMADDDHGEPDISNSKCYCRKDDTLLVYVDSNGGAFFCPICDECTLQQFDVYMKPPFEKRPPKVEVKRDDSHWQRLLNQPPRTAEDDAIIPF